MFIVHLVAESCTNNFKRTTLQEEPHSALNVQVVFCGRKRGRKRLRKLCQFVKKGIHILLINSSILFPLFSITIIFYMHELIHSLNIVSLLVPRSWFCCSLLVCMYFVNVFQTLCLTEWAIFSWLCGFVHRLARLAGNQWCCVWEMACNGLLKLKNSSSTVHFWDLHHCWRKYKTQTESVRERARVRLRLIDQQREVKMQRIRAGQCDSREMKWVMQSLRISLPIRGKMKGLGDICHQVGPLLRLQGWFYKVPSYKRNFKILLNFLWNFQRAWSLIINSQSLLFPPKLS